MVSRPTFDPNKFTGRISRTDWNEIANDKDKPLLNRAIQAQLAPGSTFKPIMAHRRTGIRRGGRQDSILLSGRRVLLRPLFRLPPEGRPWRRSPCIARSRNPATSTSITSETGSGSIVLPTTRTLRASDAGPGSIFPTKRKAPCRPPSGSCACRARNGTPVKRFRSPSAKAQSPSLRCKLLLRLGGLGAGGTWFKPHMVETDNPVLLRQGNFNPDESGEQVISGMYAVVNEGGTGRAAQLPDVKVCGKTGTAQVASSDRTKGAKLKSAWRTTPGSSPSRPHETPEIAVVALFENGRKATTPSPSFVTSSKRISTKRPATQNHLKCQTRRCRPHLLSRLRPL